MIDIQAIFYLMYDRFRKGEICKRSSGAGVWQEIREAKLIMKISIYQYNQ